MLGRAAHTVLVLFDRFCCGHGATFTRLKVCSVERIERSIESIGD